MTRRKGLIGRIKSLWMSQTPNLLVAGREGYARVSDSHAGEMVTAASALSLSSVWACVNLLAGTTASLPCVVQRAGPGGVEDAPGHPLWRLLHDSPNFDQTAFDFWEFMAASLELWGNAYAHVIRRDGRIVALRPVAPHLVTVRRLAEGPLEYSWSDEGRAYRERDDAVLHVRGFGGGPLGGMSTLTFGRQSLGLAQAVERAAGGMFRNGLRTAGALVFSDFLSPEQRELAETVLVEKYTGALNAGRPMILEGGTSWENLTINPDDAQMLENRRFSVEDICRLFGVPPHMVGHTEKSTSWGTGLEEQTLAFQKFTLRRRLKRIEQAVRMQLLSPADRAAGYTVRFNVEGLLRGDSQARAAFYREMTSIGAMTINEVRALEGRPPVAGGDVPRIQMQNAPIDQAGDDDVG